jgi:hypothetical protein
MNRKHSANSVRARARKRLSSPPDDYFDLVDTQNPAIRLTHENLLGGDKHEFLLYISPHRIDQFRVTVNGQLWKERAGLSAILVGLRKAIGRFSKRT